MIFFTKLLAVEFVESYNIMASESKHFIQSLWKILVMALVIGLSDYGKKIIVICLIDSMFTM